MLLNEPDLLLSTWRQCAWNPFGHINKDRFLNSNVSERFSDTFEVLHGKKRESVESAWKKRVGLIEYLLIPLDIIEALFYISFIGRPIAFLLMGVHFILEKVIARVLTALFAPVILSIHGICQIIKHFNPTISQGENSETQDNSTCTSQPKPSDQNIPQPSPTSASPISQPGTPLSQEKLQFTWQNFSLNGGKYTGKYTVVQHITNSQFLLFFLISKEDWLFVITDKNWLNDDQVGNNLIGNRQALGCNYTTELFEQNFPSVAEGCYKYYKPIEYGKSYAPNTLST